MSKDKLRRTHLIYGIVLSCIIILVGICFIISCIDIYRSGDRPFTRESVSQHISKIIIPIILCLVGILGGMVLSFFPLEVPLVKGEVSKKTTLSRLKSRLDYEKCDEGIKTALQRETKIRRLTSIFCLDALVVCIVISLIYALNKNNFTAENINGEMIDAMLFILPCIIVSIGAVYATVLICSCSYARELEIVKKALPVAKKEGNTDTSLELKGGKLLLGARLTVLVVALTFTVIGIFNGGMADVLQKAVNICTECIGLG